MMSVEEIKERFGILGQSSKLNDILKPIPQVARTDISVLITGESGTGKEVIAQAIHGLSQRASEKMLVVNCGAIPEGILESELFGHEKGAFTGAIEARKGYFELANQGTLFLDEIGDMPMGVQVKILRVLESGEYMRVGGTSVKRTDVRVIGATNKDLLHEVQAKRFREDLYYRLKAIQLHLPPLHERRDDIPLLFKAFWQEFARRYNIYPTGITPEAVSMLVNYHWPGNIRELRNFTESLLVLDGNKMVDESVIRRYLIHQSAPSMSRLPVLSEKQGTEKVELEYLYRMMADLKTELLDIKSILRHLTMNPSGMQTQPVTPTVIMDSYQSKLLPAPSASFADYQLEKDSDHPDEKDDHNLSLSDLERKAVEDALTRHQGNRRKAAEELQISERTLYRKIKEYGLDT